MAKKLVASVEITGKDSLSHVMQKLNARMTAVGARMKRVGRGIGAPFRVAAAPLRMLHSGVTKLASGMRSMMRGIGSVLRPIAVLGGAAVAAGIGVIRLVSGTAKAGDELGKLSRQLGFGVEELQELQFAAERSGVPVDMFAMSLRQFATRVGQAKVGMGELRTFLKTTPKSFQAAIKGANSTGEAFELVIAAISKIDDPLKRAALAGRFFGEEGVKLTRMAEGGVVGLRRLRDEARGYGVMSEAATKQSEGFVDAQTNLKQAIGGVKIALASSLLPVLQPAIERLTEWVRINRELIAQRVSKVFRKMGEALKTVDWSAFAVGIENALVLGMDLLTAFGTIVTGVLSGDMSEAAKGFTRAWETIKPFVVQMLAWLRKRLGDFAKWLASDFKHMVQNAVLDSLEALNPFMGGGLGLFGGGKVPWQGVPGMGAQPPQSSGVPTVQPSGRPMTLSSNIRIDASDQLLRLLNISGAGVQTVAGGGMRMADAGRSGVA